MDGIAQFEELSKSKFEFFPQCFYKDKKNPQTFLLQATPTPGLNPIQILNKVNWD